MRLVFACLAVFAFVKPALAEEASQQALIEQIVAGLGAPDPHARAAASRALARLGRPTAIALRSRLPRDPEASRALRAFVRKHVELLLITSGVPTRHRIGEGLRLEVRILNETDDYYFLPLTQPGRPGQTSAFFLQREDNSRRFHLRPDEVELKSRAYHQTLVIAPRGEARVLLELGGDRVPLHSPGAFHLRAGYISAAAERSDSAAQAPPRRPGKRPVRHRRASKRTRKAVHVQSSSAPVKVIAQTVPALSAALVSRDANRRRRALDELAARRDPGVLPLFRQHFADRDVAAIALPRLAARPAPEDVALFASATRNEKLSASLRRGAVAGLGRIPTSRARRALIALTFDFKLRGAAIDALLHHRDPRTIDRFVALLKEGVLSAQKTGSMRSTLYAWTGRVVQDSASEIAAFERWWRAERGAWAKRNVSDK